MAFLDVESLLEPVSESEPSGPNLEYDVVYTSLEQAARGKQEQQYGETIIPAEEPDWSEVQRLGNELITRTKDLRVACLLARALLERDGFPAFAEGLELIRGYLERYWSSVHPQLDPEDENDPTLRVNTVSSLSDQATTVRSLRFTPIVSSRLMGQFSLRDLGVATGEIPPSLNEEAPKLSTIEGAFMECELEVLRDNANAVRKSIEHAEAIEITLTREVGAARALSLENLRNTLRELHIVLDDNLSRRDVGVGDEVPGDQSGMEGDGAPAAAVRLTGEIRSREDAVLALEKICQYYSRYEPSSPLPLLLNRAKRLASKNFLEIVKDLTPDAVAQVQALGGVGNDEVAD